MMLRDHPGGWSLIHDDLRGGDPGAYACPFAPRCSRVQGTLHPCRWPDAGRGAAVDLRPGIVARGAVSVPPRGPRESEAEGVRMDMPSTDAMTRPFAASGGTGEGRSAEASRVSRRDLCAAATAVSSLTQITSRATKETRLPAAASSHAGPELSAREARSMPDRKRTVRKPFIFTPACSAVFLPYITRLASPDDNPSLTRGDSVTSRGRRGRGRAQPACMLSFPRGRASRGMGRGGAA